MWKRLIFRATVLVLHRIIIGFCVPAKSSWFSRRYELIDIGFDKRVNIYFKEFFGRVNNGVQFQ